MEPPTLALNDVSKSFERRLVVNDLNLAIGPGELYALLGPNGAGKTTTMRMAAGLLAPDAGSIRIVSLDTAAAPLAARRLTAWVPDEPPLYDRLTGWEHLEFIAGLWELEPRAAQTRAEGLLQRLDLWDHRHERCQGYSRGMKQKTALACALLHEPRLLLLDEPLTGLDAVAARQVKDLLQDLVQNGVTVVLSTHILEIAERLADRIGILHRGRVRAEGDLDHLRSLASGRQSLEDVFLELTGDSGATVA